MKFSRELLPGAWQVMLRRLDDTRGRFVKTWARSAVDTIVPGIEFAEEFYSVSANNVIRGMHFQTPPHDHLKLVYCPVGTVLDVLVDLRCGTGQGAVASTILNEDEPSLLIIPKGVAHGFRSLRNDSLLIYKTTTEYAPDHDAGIRWDSFGFDWGLTNPVISPRDLMHPTLADFDNPF